MDRTPARVDGDLPDVPQVVLQALFRHPETLASILADANLGPHALRDWARRSGRYELEKLAAWSAVGQRSSHYQPLLELADAQVRAGEWHEALPILHWAKQRWQASPPAPGRRSDGLRLLTLWGECLHRTGDGMAAQQTWLAALGLVRSADELQRLARAIEQTGAGRAYGVVLAQARLRALPSAHALGLYRQGGPCAREMAAGEGFPTTVQPSSVPAQAGPGLPRAGTVCVLADVANLELVCRDQHGWGRRLDYGRLLDAAGQQGEVKVRLAFVPELPETEEVRRHLQACSFRVELIRPKHSSGRIQADADAALAAAAVRWASDPNVACVEIWSGDRDLLAARTMIAEAWPHVQVRFRSFEAGTAAGIRQLGEGWQPISTGFLVP